MLKVIFAFLSFKPAYDTKKSFSINVSSFNGITASTERVEYSPEQNVAVFSEILQISPFSKKNGLLVIEVFKHEEGSSSVSIAKRMLEINSESLMKINEKPLSMKSNLTASKLPNEPLDLIIKLGITFLKGALDKDTPKSVELGFLKPFFDEMMEFSTDQKGEFEVLKANSINTNYIKKITPIVYISNYFTDVLNWKSPTHTLIFGGAVTAFILYSQILLVLSLVLFYINTPFFLRQILKIERRKINKNLNVFERNKLKLMKLKRNITHIQGMQKDYIKKHDYFKRLLFSEDRTEIIELMLILRRYVFFIVPFLLLFTTTQCILIGFWTLLVKNSMYGSSLLGGFHEKFEKFSVFFNEKIDYLVLKFKIFPVPPPQTDYFRKNSDNQSSQKTFVIYENQRWWLGKGWIDLMLPGERAKFSDIDGILALDFKKINLPEPEDAWMWEDDWKVDINENTDKEGWEYAYDFKNTFHKKNEKLDYARRRKWFRKCIKIDTDDGIFT